MKILHLIRDMEEILPIEVAWFQQQGGHQVTLLLLHDAVLRDISFPGRVLACGDDLLARGVGGKYPSLDYEGIVQALFNHDRVISW